MRIGVAPATKDASTQTPSPVLQQNQVSESLPSSQASSVVEDDEDDGKGYSTKFAYNIQTFFK